LLLPLLLSLMILSVMIVSGIQRNRARLTANSDRLRDSVAILERFRDAAADFLRNEQNADGSWSYRRGPSRELGATSPVPDVASTERILLNGRRAGYEEADFYTAGLRFVERPTGERQGAQVTLLRSLLLRRTIEPRELASSNPLAFDLLRLGTFPSDGGSISTLQASIRGRLNASPRPAADWLELGYFVLLASESGNPAFRSLLPRMLEGFRSRAGTNPWAELDTLALASYLALLGEDCRRRSDPCTNGNEPLGALVGRRRPDGSWPSGTLAEPDGTFGGSVVETTSLVLSALSTFHHILQERARSK
jgi:hypothetical protein